MKFRDLEEIARIKAKQKATGSRTATYIGDGGCLYRGLLIERYDGTPAGHYGRYRVHTGTGWRNFSSMNKARSWVDTDYMQQDVNLIISMLHLET